ncbi:TPA: hypothetical protein DEG21_00275 [Patescibacteria group bacterium]|nr:hypothetical protein [Candidatus Gracilibacteria bacterium]HBY74362.1 hypothetical protein [Candidatus Gracilibacteria bacterium]
MKPIIKAKTIFSFNLILSGIIWTILIEIITQAPSDIIFSNIFFSIFGLWVIISPERLIMKSINIDIAII